MNPGNTFSSGILSISADGQGAVLTAEGLVPGDSATGAVRIVNSGSVDGSSWKLTQAVTSSQPGTDPSDATAHGDLADKLQLEIDDQSTGDQVYAGTRP